MLELGRNIIILEFGLQHKAIYYKHTDGKGVDIPGPPHPHLHRAPQTRLHRLGGPARQQGACPSHQRGTRTTAKQSVLV
jgi:hypothetical protein